jgi:hypothetical protein
LRQKYRPVGNTVITIIYYSYIFYSRMQHVYSLLQKFFVQMIWNKESVDEKQDFPRSAVIFSKKRSGKCSYVKGIYLHRKWNTVQWKDANITLSLTMSDSFPFQK